MNYLACFLLLVSAVYSANAVNRCSGNPNDLEVISNICTTCCCYKDAKNVDCHAVNLFDLFIIENWQDLNATDFIVQTLDLSYNSIENVTLFPEMSVLKLNLSNNHISLIVDGAFANLTNLEILDLSSNHLTSNILKPHTLHGGYNAALYQPLTNLKVLRLGNNNLHSLDKDLFEHTPFLEELSLDTNPFKIIDYSALFAISSLGHLKILDLSYMELESLSDDIFHRPLELKVVNLTGNLLTEIPAALRWGENIDTLLLDENPIKSIEGEHIFPKMRKLKTLSISYTPTMERIGKGGLSGLVNLSYLYIQNNHKLTTIHGDAFSREGEEEKSRVEWPPLKHLYLNHNNLSNLESALVGTWSNLDAVDFTNNPWACDCDNQWLVDVLMPIIQTENNSHFLQDVVCKYPEEMEGIHLSKLADEHSQMRCFDFYGNHPGRDGMVLVGILVGLLIGIPLTLGLVWAYRQGYLGFMGERGPADFSRAFYKRAGNQDDFYI